MQRSDLTVVVCGKTRRRRRYFGRLSPDGVKIETKVVVCVDVSSGEWEGLEVRNILDGPIHTFQSLTVTEVVKGKTSTEAMQRWLEVRDNYRGSAV
jgi:hypothetical protein